MSKQSHQTKRGGPVVPPARFNGLTGAPSAGVKDPDRLAQIVAHGLTNPVKFWNGEWWQWQTSKYTKVPAHQLDVLIRKIILNEFAKIAPLTGVTPSVNSRLVTETRAALQALVYLEAGRQPFWIGGKDRGRVLAFDNGHIRLEKLVRRGKPKLEKSSSDYFSTLAFPYPFKRRGSCPKWLSFLHEVLDGDSERIETLQEFFGYCLIEQPNYQKMLVMVGSGANGKSVVCDVLEALVGVENVAHQPWSALSRNFGLEPLLDKCVNIASEATGLESASEAVIKLLSSGDGVSVNKKHQKQVEARLRVRLVLACNQLPEFRDASHAIFRRFLIIPFDRFIPEEKRDVRLAEKIIASEISAIANWALEGLIRLMGKNRFTDSGRGAEELARLRARRNPAETFLEECCRPAAGRSVSRALVYQEYAEWARRNGYKPLNAGDFGVQVERHFGITATRPREGAAPNRPRAYVGIELTRTSVVHSLKPRSITSTIRKDSLSVNGGPRGPEENTEAA